MHVNVIKCKHVKKSYMVKKRKTKENLIIGCDIFIELNYLQIKA